MFGSSLKNVCRVLRVAWPLGWIFWLFGCAGVTPSQQPQAESAVLPRVYHQSIELGGRISVRYRKNDKEEALHGSFSWSQTAQQTSIDLRSPLGQSVAVIEITPGNASLAQAGLATVSATDADALLSETFGWSLPVSGLRDWLQGFVADRDGRRVALTPQGDGAIDATADGWDLHFISWQPEGAAIPKRPKRIDLARRAGQVDELALRIVIDEWQAQQ